MTRFPPFVPRFPWLGGDLQTLRNVLTRSTAHLPPAEVLLLKMRDGTGDRLFASLHRPPGTDLGRGVQRPTGKPLAILIHGLTGCEDSPYIRNSAAWLLRHGYPVLRLNLRGAGPSRPLCRFTYHAGRTQDLRDAIADLPADLTAFGLVLVGYSLGGNMLLKYLGEEEEGAGLVRAAASVSAPINLKATCRFFMRRRAKLYHDWLLGKMKREFVGPGAQAEEKDRLRVFSVPTIYAFDDRVVAPANGFAGAEDYYDRSSAQGYLAGVRVPTLVVLALDDPWIPARSYADVEWSRLPAITPLVVPAGGHIGFHGTGSPTPWHDRCLLIHLESVLGGPV